MRTRPPHLNNVAALPCEMQLIWCLPDSRPHTQRINRLLSEPPAYYWGRLNNASKTQQIEVIWILIS